MNKFTSYYPVGLDKCWRCDSKSFSLKITMMEEVRVYAFCGPCFDIRAGKGFFRDPLPGEFEAIEVIMS